MSAAGSDRPEIQLRLDPVRIALGVVIVVFGVAAILFLRAPAGPPPPPKPGAPIAGPVGSADLSKDVSVFDRAEPDASRPGPGAGSSKPAAPAPSAPLSRPDSAAPEARTGSEGMWSVQVFSGEAGAAEFLRRRLVSGGWAARVEPVGGGRARVRVGEYGARDEAERAAKRLALSEGLKPWVVSSSP